MSTDAIPDPRPSINNCLEQWSERVFLFNWVTLRSVQLVWREIVKQLSATPLNSFKRGKPWQRPCIEIRHCEKVVNTRKVPSIFKFSRMLRLISLAMASLSTFLVTHLLLVYLKTLSLMRLSATRCHWSSDIKVFNVWNRPRAVLV